MRAEVIGQFSIKVDPDTKGFETGLKRGLDSALGKSSLGKIDAFGGRITSSIGGAFKRVAKLGAGVVAGFIGSALFKGGQRVLAIEDATSRMEGLGLSSQKVDKLSENLLKTLKGTPFALDDASKSMATMVAAGTPLADVDRNMKLIIDSAAFAKVPLNDIASVFQTIQARGRLTAEELNRFTDRGVPALTLLADAAGVSANKFREMVTTGQVDAEDFFDLWEKGAKGFGENNAVMEGAAQKMGETTRGSLQNLMAAMARLGASVLTNLLGPFKAGVGGATATVDRLTEVLGPLAERFTEWAQETIQSQVVPALQRMGAIFQSEVLPRLQAFVDWVVDNQESIRDWAGTVTIAVGAVTAFAVGVHAVSTAFQVLKAATPIGILLLIVTALVRLYQTNEQFREAVQRAFKVAVTAIENFLTAIRGGKPSLDAFRGAGSGVTNVVTTIVTAIKTGFPIVRDIVVRVWKEIVAFTREIWPQVRGIISTVLEIVGTVVRGFVNAVMGVWDRWGATILRVARVIWDAIKELIRAALKIIQGVLNVFLGVIRGDWSKVWQGIKQILAGVWDAMFAIVRAAVRTVVAVLAGMATNIKRSWNEFWDAVQRTVSRTWDRIVSGARSFRGAVAGAFSNLRADIRSAINGAISIINGLIIAWNTVMRRFGFNSLTVGTLGGVGVFRDTNSGRGGVTRATGGPIQGRPGKDKIQAWLTDDEHVWTPQEVKAAGGHSGVYALRKAVLNARGLRPEELLQVLARGFIKPSGGDPRFANGGQVGGANSPAARGYGVYIRRLIRRFTRGYPVFEDFTFPGMGRFAKKYNDRVADRFYGTHRRFNFDSTPASRRIILRALRSYLPRFAAGGMVAAKSFARAQNGKPYIWGGVGPRGYDCSGIQSAVLNVLEGKRAYSRRFTTGSISASLPGLDAGLAKLRGGYSIGSRRGSPGHMVGTLDGVNIEAGNPVKYGGFARGAANAGFPMKFHATKFGGMDWKDAIAKVVTPILNRLLGNINTGSMPGVFGRLGRALIDRAKKVVFTPKRLEDRTKDIANFHSGGPVLADQLALLQRGEFVQSKAMLAAGRHRRPDPIVLRVDSAGSQLDDLLVQVLRRAIRTRGGNVQSVLGSR